MDKSWIIRFEKSGDVQSIADLNVAAFKSKEEAFIIDSLRQSGDLFLSMVAVMDDKIVGHIAFSPMTIEGQEISFVGLGPMAVSPEYQRQGIGSDLIHNALKILKEKGVEACFVLGHPDYYPRFGFKPSFSTYHIKSIYDVPDPVFMALELKEGVLSGFSSVTIDYADSFPKDI